MTQLKHVVDPFGEVNVYPDGKGRQRVTATILMDPFREGCQTGIALDGSASMASLYGTRVTGAVSTFFGRKPATENLVSPVAQSICAYLARNLDADGGTTCIYWATGPAGSEVEVIGDFQAEQVEKHLFSGPRSFGTGTQLLPAVRYFLDRFVDAPWGFYVFITDGELHDLDEVKQYTRQLANDIASKRRRPIKLILIGVGPDVNERQMIELDDLQTGTSVDIWDHKLAGEMRVLESIFAEVVDENARVAPKGKILAPDGTLLRDYSDLGVPALLEFEAPAGLAYFTLEIPGARVHQPLTDSASYPEAERSSSSQPSSAPGEPSKDVRSSEPIEIEEIQEPNEPAEFDLTLEFDNDKPDVSIEPAEPDRK